MQQFNGIETVNSLTATVENRRADVELRAAPTKNG